MPRLFSNIKYSLFYCIIYIGLYFLSDPNSFYVLWGLMGLLYLYQNQSDSVVWLHRILEFGLLLLGLLFFHRNHPQSGLTFLLAATWCRLGLFPFHLSFLYKETFPTSDRFFSLSGLFPLLRFASLFEGSGKLFFGLLFINAVYMGYLSLAVSRPMRLLVVSWLAQLSWVLLAIFMQESSTLICLLLGHLFLASWGSFGVISSFIKRGGEEARGGWVRITPVLSGFFIVFGFSLVNIPGTIGFFAEDAILHSVISSHGFPVMVPMLVAMGLLGFSWFRLYAKLFCGPSRIQTPDIDLNPSERFAYLTACILILCMGIFPQVFIHILNRIHV